MYAARYIAVYTLEKKKKCYKSYIGVKYWFLILAAEELKFLYFIIVPGEGRTSYHLHLRWKPRSSLCHRPYQEIH